jgi:hypothetical protein
MPHHPCSVLPHNRPFPRKASLLMPAEYGADSGIAGSAALFLAEPVPRDKQSAAEAGQN